MIKLLQRKFVITAMTAVSVLILLLLGAVNGANILVVQNNVTDTLNTIMDNDGDPGNALSVRDTLSDSAPDGKSANDLANDLDDGSNNDLENDSADALGDAPDDVPASLPPDALNAPKNEYDTLMSSNYFIVRLNTEGESVFVDVSRTSVMTEDEAESLAKELCDSGSTSGKVGKFRYLLRADKAGGTTAVFLDTSDESLSYLRVLLLSVSVGAVCWLLMLLFVSLLSRRAIRPIAESWERQKRFVSDAGHEIKTPLAIIQSNTEAMELYNGENKWSRNIKAQTRRLSGLMNQLLTLSRMDEGAGGARPVDFCVSQTLTDVLEGFLQPASVRQITVCKEVQQEISLHADPAQIEQLCSILLDNAVKYTDEGGEIRVRLEKTGKRVQLQVENTCESLPEASPEKLFERFYRADAARTQKSGGYGIGLSLAKTIAEANGGRIQAEYMQPNRIRFTANF